MQHSQGTARLAGFPVLSRQAIEASPTRRDGVSAADEATRRRLAARLLDQARLSLGM